MKKRILFLSALALFLSSCGIFSPLSENTGSISIKMPEGSERNETTTDDPVSEITSFTVELYDSERTSGSSPVVQISSVPGESITLESLAPGSYTIAIKAFKPSAASCAAYGEKTGVIVKAGATTYETITLRWVITDWETLYEKLNDQSGDVGNIYVMGDFEITSKIIFSGTANIISTATGVTFTRSGSFTDDFFYLNPKSLTFKGSESAPIVFDGKNIEASLITNWGTTTFEYCSFQNNSSSSFGSVYLSNTPKTTFKSCTFTGNISSKGGAVYISDSATVTFSDCIFENNTSSSDGGAVYISDSATVTFSDCTFERNGASSHGRDIYNNGTLNIGGTIGNSAGSIDIYMNNTSEYSPVLVPVKGITLAEGTDTINVTMTTCSEGITVLTQSAGMTTSDFAAAIKCFTLTNDGFVIGSDGKAETEPTGTTVSSFSELTNCLSLYSDSKATANIVISKNIEITGTVTICCNVNINADAAGRTLSRGTGVTDALFKIGDNVTGVTVNVGESGGTLTIDGNGDNVTALYSLINAGSKGNTVKISKNAILQNNVTSRTHGAAIYANGSTVIIEGGKVQNNNCSAKSDSCGGAIYATNFEMSSGYLYGNKSVDAGGVYVLGSAKITGGTISNNTASNYGGGIYLVGVTNSSISGVTFERNTGNTRGGAIYIAGTSTVDITDCTFTDNVSNNGKAFAFELTGGTTSIGGKINITNDDNIVIYGSNGILNISKSLEITNRIPLTISIVTSGHQYITASEDITLSDEIAKFSLQNEGKTLTETGLVQ